MVIHLQGHASFSGLTILKSVSDTSGTRDCVCQRISVNADYDFKVKKVFC